MSAPIKRKLPRFDGVWIGELSCPGWRGRFAGDRFTAQAEPPARPCSLRLARAPSRSPR